MTITETEKGLFLFQWSFDSHLLVLGRVHVGAIMANIPLVHVPFWVQIHNLPLGFMTATLGTYLGNFIITFMEYDKTNSTNLWRKYMRIRVMIDVRLPLKKKKKVKIQGGIWSTMVFKYERLGVFFFLYGLLAHSDKSCDDRFLRQVDDGSRG